MSPALEFDVQRTESKSDCHMRGAPGPQEQGITQQGSCE
jgi:hypothetical protein